MLLLLNHEFQSNIRSNQRLYSVSPLGVQHGHKSNLDLVKSKSGIFMSAKIGPLFCLNSLKIDDAVLVEGNFRNELCTLI